MASNSQFGGAGAGTPSDCAQFEAQLMDALDGLLSAAGMAEFRRHADACVKCGPMFREIEQGMLALHSLDEAEPPETLIHNVLAQTSYAASALGAPMVSGRRRGWFTRLREGIARPLFQPRFAMSAATAFFSITLLLNVGGVTANDIRMLRPTTVKNTAMLKFSEIEARIVKYFDNLRIVYEFESRIKEFTSKPQNDDKKPTKSQPAETNKETSQLRDGAPCVHIVVKMNATEDRQQMIGPSQRAAQDNNKGELA